MKPGESKTKKEPVRVIDARHLPLRESTSLIVFDLEWNQCPYGKSREVHTLPFEIVDIGAVKLDRHLNILDTFHCFVRPTVYKSLHYQTRRVISISPAELLSGTDFPDAARQFFSFCGEDYLFCSWGDQDVMELQRNLAHYGMSSLLPGPVIFEDVQKLFAVAYESRIRRRALESAAEFLHIDTSLAYHRALDDAIVTAAVLQKIPEEIIESDFSLDTWQHPATREEEFRLQCKGCEKYISREFRSKEAAMRDREVRAVRCIVCGKPSETAPSWTSSRSGRQYSATGKCSEHGGIFSRIRIKETGQGPVYVEKITKCLPDE